MQNLSINALIIIIVKPSALVSSVLFKTYKLDDIQPELYLYHFENEMSSSILW
jgi:hypothetical protein